MTESKYCINGHVRYLGVYLIVKAWGAEYFKFLHKINTLLKNLIIPAFATFPNLVGQVNVLLFKVSYQIISLGLMYKRAVIHKTGRTSLQTVNLGIGFVGAGTPAYIREITKNGKKNFWI